MLLDEDLLAAVAVEITLGLVAVWLSAKPSSTRLESSIKVAQFVSPTLAFICGASAGKVASARLSRMPGGLPAYHELKCRSRRSQPRIKVSEPLYLTLAECWERCQEQLSLYVTLRWDMPAEEDARILESRIVRLSQQDESFGECFEVKVECCTQLVGDTNLEEWLEALLDGDDKLPVYPDLFHPDTCANMHARATAQQVMSAATLSSLPPKQSSRNSRTHSATNPIASWPAAAAFSQVLATPSMSTHSAPRQRGSSTNAPRTAPTPRIRESYPTSAHIRSQRSPSRPVENAPVQPSSRANNSRITRKPVAIGQSSPPPQVSRVASQTSAQEVQAGSYQSVVQQATRPATRLLAAPKPQPVVSVTSLWRPGNQRPPVPWV